MKKRIEGDPFGGLPPNLPDDYQVTYTLNFTDEPSSHWLKTMKKKSRLIEVHPGDQIQLKDGSYYTVRKRRTIRLPYSREP